VLDIVDDSAIYRVRQTTGNLQYPKDDADVSDTIYFTEAEGEGGGTQTKVRCNNDGHFKLLESSAAIGMLFIDAEDCLLDSSTINGAIIRSKANNEFGIESIVETMTDVTLQNATEFVYVSTGTFKYDEGHPVAILAYAVWPIALTTKLIRVP